MLDSKRSVILAAAIAICLGFAAAASATPGDVCGEPTITTLYAGQTLDAGTVTVANDCSHLYVEVSTAGDWLLTETHLAIALTLDGIPQTRSGNPRVGNFPYQRSYDPPAGSDLYVFALDGLAESLGVPQFDCGTTSLVVAAHAVVVQLDDGGDVIAQETGWADGPGFPGRSWATYFDYTVQCCDPEPGGIERGDFRTQTQGGWGTSCRGNNPGCYRDAHFASCLTGGLVAGDAAGFTLTLTDSETVEVFLPQGGTPGALLRSHVDPTETEAGVLAGQVVALTLSVSFDLCDVGFGASPVNLRDLVVCDPASDCLGMTVAEVLAAGNATLAGLAAGFSPPEINGCLSRINENFVDGEQVGTFLCLP